MSDAIEQLDVVDATGRYSRTADRDTVHRNGWWHQVFHCLIVRTDLPARIVLQRRHDAAAAYPGHLDLSATGHLAAGETPLDGVRELREEMGIDADPADLVALGRRLIADDRGEGGANREIVHAFLLPDDRPLADFDLEGCDVAGIVEITTDNLLAMLATPTIEVPCLERTTDGPVIEATCTAGDLAFHDDPSWTVIAVMAERYVRGQRPLAI